jgi:ribosome biogenesis GTPase / thiamine phosphate phosphatase
MSLLVKFGFNSHFNNLFAPFKLKGLQAGRVISVKGFKYLLISENGELDCELSGGLLNSKEQWELPKVGDWVVFVPIEGAGYIVDVLQRLNQLTRKLPGKGIVKQVLVANVDYAFIVQGLDQDFNLMRLQRYLHQVYENNINPIVILNKADLVADPAECIEKVKSLAFDVPVYLTSIVSAMGFSDLENHVMESGKTYVLIGSSGVGKSSILNILLKADQQLTNVISQANNKGQHTTTSRYLTALWNGALLIDTPGMREFGIISDENAENFIHPKIEELSARCKFPDCTHENEPGCAVKEAVEEGVLPEIVYNSFLKLRKEQFCTSVSAWDKKKKERQAGKISREAQQHKKNWKYE